VGQPCPNNPFHKHRDEISRLGLLMPRIRRSLQLLDEVELGIKRGDSLTLADFELLRAAKTTMEERRRRLLARELSAAIAELFGESKK
jgi:hypothetical protein